MRSLCMLGLSAFAAIAATTATAQPLRPWSAVDAERAAGHQVFLDHCAACHVQQSGMDALAPSLDGVLGRRAGSVAGFPYSGALKSSGIVWSEPNLRKWVADSRRMVPGTLMPHVSIGDPVEQLYVVEYLKTLKSPAH